MKTIRLSAALAAVSLSLLLTIPTQAREGQALLQAVQGTAQFTSDGKKWISAQPGQLLKTGASFRTAAGSQADLFLGINGSLLRLAPSTELRFNRLMIEETLLEPIAETEFELKSGRVIGNVTKLPKGSSYVVKTPTGTARVTGTIYDLNAEGGLVVLKGTVSYTDKATGKVMVVAQGAKAANGQVAAATAAEKKAVAGNAPSEAPLFPAFKILSPLEQGIWETKRLGELPWYLSPTPTAFGDLVVRSGSEFAPDRFEIVLDANTASEFEVGQELKPSDLDLKIQGLEISDDLALITVEGTAGGQKILVVRSRTEQPLVAEAGLAEASSVPVRVSIPTAGSSVSVPVELDLMAPMEAPSMVIKTDEGAPKSINIETDGFTEDEADAYLDEFVKQFENAGNFQIGDAKLNPDEVDVVVTKVETGNPLTPIKIQVAITPKNPDDTLPGLPGVIEDSADLPAIGFTPEPSGIGDPTLPPPPPIVVPPTLPPVSPVSG